MPFTLPHQADWPLPASVPSLASLLARSPPREADQIERDLHRVGRAQLGIDDDHADAFVSRLRQLLHAWCGRGEGYAQAMSHIAAILVADAQDVEGAFCTFAWLMVSLPSDYFDLGHRVDVRALRLLAAARWPDVIEPSLYEALELVTTQWFLTLYSSALPPESCLAVWALLLVDPHPSHMPLRVALVLLATSLPEILDAAQADTAEFDDIVATEASVGIASYVAFQRAPQNHSSPHVLVEAARALNLPAEAVEEARATAKLQLEAEVAARERAQLKQAQENAKKLAETSTEATSSVSSVATQRWVPVKVESDPVLEGRMMLEAFDQPSVVYPRAQQNSPIAARPWREKTAEAINAPQPTASTQPTPTAAAPRKALHTSPVPHSAQGAQPTNQSSQQRLLPDLKYSSIGTGLSVLRIGDVEL